MKEVFFGNFADRSFFFRYDIFDTNKHGTRCAGQVAAMANNSLCSGKKIVVNKHFENII
jgi:hypothetical protein